MPTRPPRPVNFKTPTNPAVFAIVAPVVFNTVAKSAPVGAGALRLLWAVKALESEGYRSTTVDLHRNGAADPVNARRRVRELITAGLLTYARPHPRRGRWLDLTAAGRALTYELDRALSRASRSFIQ